MLSPTKELSPILKTALLLLAFIICLLLAIAPVWAGTWIKPEFVANADYYTPGSSAAMDAAGNTVVTWPVTEIVQGVPILQVWAKLRSTTGLWSAQEKIFSKANPNNNIHIGNLKAIANDKGVFIVTWNEESSFSDLGGIYWIAERSIDKPWIIQNTIHIYDNSALFSINKKGNALLVWNTKQLYALGSSTIMYMRRTTGRWSLPQTLISGINLGATQAVLGENDDALIAWETYEKRRAFYVKRGQVIWYNYAANSKLHISRQTKGNTLWKDSGILATGDVDGLISPHPSHNHGSQLIMDSSGRAGCFYVNKLYNLMSITQSATGQPWSQPQTIWSNCCG